MRRFRRRGPAPTPRRALRLQLPPLPPPKLPEPAEAEELVSLEEADAEENTGKVKAVVPESEDDIEIDETIEDDDDDDSTFIADEEEGDEDVTDIIGDVGRRRRDLRSTLNCVQGSAPRVAQGARKTYGAIAQLGERLHGMQEVGGSIPPGSTSLRASPLRLG